MKRLTMRILKFFPVWLLTRKAGFSALALAAPLMAMTAAFALAGTVPSSTLESSTTSTVTADEALSAQATSGTTTATTTATTTETTTATTTATTTDTTTPTATATTTPTPPQEGTAEARDPHANGHGCDDVLFAASATPGPGGPVGCTVGNSGSHRQNGLEHGNATATASASASPSASPSPSATTQGPHANGKGCDDIIFALGRTLMPGGPIGCTVGNSGAHRQNGLHGNLDATAGISAGAAGSTATAGVSTTARMGHGFANGHSKH